MSLIQTRHCLGNTEPCGLEAAANGWAMSLAQGAV